MESLNEKDLWCKDLDDFEVEWENQLKLDAEISTNIRRMGRRMSKKIGAGRGRKAKGDDDWAPAAKSKAAPKATAAKPKLAEAKAHQRFAEKFAARPKAKKINTDGADDSDPFSDDDYATLKSKPVKPTTTAKEESAAEEAPVRSKRAAATKAKTWIVDDESESNGGGGDDDDDGDKMLGDVGDLVKGITNGNGAATGTENKTGRLSLFAMSRPGSSHGNAATMKPKAKPSMNFDLDSLDDTNYEMLAKGSPRKSVKPEDIDSFLSDDDQPVVKVPAKLTKSSSNSASDEPKSAPAPDPAPAAASATAESSSTGAAAAAAAPAVKKSRGRPAGAKNKAKDDPPVTAPAAKAKKPSTSSTVSKASAASKPVTLSPAAKAYAAKKQLGAKSQKDVFGMGDSDSDDDLQVADADVVASPGPRPAAARERGRPGRAALTRTQAKPKPVYTLDSEADEDGSAVQADPVESSDVFAMEDSE